MSTVVKSDEHLMIFLNESSKTGGDGYLFNAALYLGCIINYISAILFGSHLNFQWCFNKPKKNSNYDVVLLSQQIYLLCWRHKFIHAKNIKSAQIRQYSNQNSNVISYIKTNRIDGVQYLKQNEESCLLHTKQNIYVKNLVNYKHTAFISSRSLAASPGWLKRNVCLFPKRIMAPTSEKQ